MAKKKMSAFTEVTSVGVGDYFPLVVDQATTPKSRRVSRDNAFASIGENGIDCTPTGDADCDLVTVGVTGAPKLWWDESLDCFSVTKPISSPFGGGADTFRMGPGAGNDTATGASSTLVGSIAGAAITSGKLLTLIGHQAGTKITDGWYDVAVGANALRSAVATTNNMTAIGTYTMELVTTGNNCTALGTSALCSATESVSNTAIGSHALKDLLTSAFNTAVGHQAGLHVLGEKNTCVGFEAGCGAEGTSTYHSTVMVGYRAGWAMTTGLFNTLVGFQAGVAQTTANLVTAVGYNALNKNNAANSVAFGASAGFEQTSGTENTWIGYTAGYFNATGAGNTGVGYRALEGTAANSFDNNTALGRQTGIALTTGSTNVLIGAYTGDNLTTGSGNILIGYDIAATAVNSTNTLNIGNLIKDDATTTLFAHPIAVGATTTSSPDNMVNVYRAVAGDGAVLGNGHCFSDSSAVTRTGTIAYNSYDARISVGGAADYNHFAAFQAAPTLGTSGTIGKLYGFVDAPVVSAGTVTDRFGVHIDDPTGDGVVTNNYGLYVEALTKGATINYAVRTMGATMSYFGGNIAVGIAPVDYRAISVGGANTVTPTWYGIENLATNTGGMVGFNAKCTTTGVANVGLIVGMYSQMTHDSNGTLANFYGSYTLTTNNGGACTNAYGHFVAAAAGTGTITNVYGVYVAEQTKGATLNYAFYSAGATPSLLNGPLHLINVAAPAANADGAVLYSADQAAGNACVHAKTEGGGVIKLYQQAHIADAAGGTEVATINAILAALENNGLLAAA